MTPAAQKLVADFETAAQVAQDAEARLRKSMAEELARIERERAFAFRRTRLIRLLASSTTGAEDQDAALAAQAQAVAAELGLDPDNDAHREVIENLKPLGEAVWTCACAREEHSDPAPTSAALHDFEAWFLKARGQPFYVLFDRYIPETPLIDF
jgi:hypothetical protein